MMVDQELFECLGRLVTSAQVQSINELATKDKSVSKITPGISVGGLSFGDEYDQIVRVMISPIREVARRNGLKLLQYPDFTLVFEQNRMVEISFNSLDRIRVSNESMAVWSDRKVLEFFSSQDPDAYQSLGFIVFNTLCVSLAGFESESDDDRALNFFIAGRWDTEIQTMSRWSLISD
jgi:hypothetical protein